MGLLSKRLWDPRDRASPPAPNRGFHALYHVEWDASKKKYDWENGPDFTGPHKRLQPSWRGRESFLTIFQTQLFHPFLQPLLKRLVPYWWSMIHTDSAPNDQHIAAMIGNSYPEAFASAVQFMRRLDTGLSGIRLSQNIAELGRSDAGNTVIAVHDTPTGSVEWSFEEESGGTRNLLPLALKVILALNMGDHILIDELGANMHPNLTHEIVRMFQSPITNPRRAQLIFTSHDATMQSEQLLRRDQIWFTEKRPDGSTDLYPLTDFKARNDRDIYSSYIDGRYGAVPVLPPLETLLPEEVTR